MNLFSSVTNAVRSAVRSTEPSPVSIDRVPAGVTTVPLPRPALAGDTFEQLPRPRVDLGASGLHASLGLASVSADAAGVTVTAARFTAEQTQKRGVGVSTEVFGDTLGAHFKVQDGPATLGAVSLKAGGQELSIGIMPAAPMPLPVPVYAGKERK